MIVAGTCPVGFGCNLVGGSLTRCCGKDFGCPLNSAGFVNPNTGSHVSCNVADLRFGVLRTPIADRAFAPSARVPTASSACAPRCSARPSAARTRRLREMVSVSESSTPTVLSDVCGDDPPLATPNPCSAVSPCPAGYNCRNGRCCPARGAVISCVCVRNLHKNI